MSDPPTLPSGPQIHLTPSTTPTSAPTTSTQVSTTAPTSNLQAVVLQSMQTVMTNTLMPAILRSVDQRIQTALTNAQQGQTPPANSVPQPPPQASGTFNSFNTQLAITTSQPVAGSLAALHTSECDTSWTSREAAWPSCYYMSNMVIIEPYTYTS